MYVNIIFLGASLRRRQSRSAAVLSRSMWKLTPRDSSELVALPVAAAQPCSGIKELAPYHGGRLSPRFFTNSLDLFGNRRRVKVAQVLADHSEGCSIRLRLYYERCLIWRGHFMNFRYSRKTMSKARAGHYE